MPPDEERIVSSVPGLPAHYTKVAALMLCWADDTPQVQECTKEVLQLRKLFEEDMEIQVKTIKLTATDADPQVQLQKAIIDLIYEHDRKDERRLLIVYYSGHGFFPTDRQNELIFTRIDGTRPPSETRRASDTYEPSANWSQAERILREHTSSDTLVILDCCYAGNVLHEFKRSDNDRCYEVMVATGWNGLTASPGPDSYTAALIDSLKALRQRGEPVTTWELAQAIMKKQKWKGKSNLHPVLLGRGGRHIVLAFPERVELHVELPA